MSKALAALPGKPLGRRRPGSSNGDPTTARRQWGFVFIAPWLFGLAVFTAGPIIVSFILSLTDFNLLRPEAVRFIGLNNYAHLANDPNVHQVPGRNSSGSPSSPSRSRWPRASASPSW